MKVRIVQAVIFVACLSLIAACSTTASTATSSNSSNANSSNANSSNANSSVTIRGEIWADNWFALYNGETLIKEDSVPITTERSFNSESFTFQASYPLHLNFVVKDYKANDTGLEYIGTPKQQMGDGGFVAQFTDVATGKVIAVTNQSAKVLVVHKSPLNAACAKEANPIAGQGTCTFTATLEPSTWKKPDFDDSAWSNASVFTAAAVGPKDGYLDIAWNSDAKFIWGSDLFADNTVLVRMNVAAP
jgi:hypothetical protein